MALRPALRRADVRAGVILGDGEAGNLAEDFQGVDGSDAGGAVNVAPGGADVVADVRAGFGLGDAEAGDVAELFEGVDRGDEAVAVDITLSQGLMGA